MDSAAAKAAFDDRGYVVLEDFFDDAIMDHLDSLIRDHFGRNPEFVHDKDFLERSQAEVVPWFPQREGTRDFDAIEHDERLQEGLPARGSPQAQSQSPGVHERHSR